jgi:hypothetical protein
MVSFTLWPLPPKEKTAPSSHYLDFWVGPRAYMDAVEERDIFTLAGNIISIHLAFTHSLVSILRYPGTQHIREDNINADIK